jgi:hypothetical protein
LLRSTGQRRLPNPDPWAASKAIAGRILERGADYLLVLKANHGKAFLAVRGSVATTLLISG